MEEVKKYKYYYRPEYSSDNFLIEIFNGAENKSFVNDFLNAISSIFPKTQDVQDLWMNDEVVLKLESELGEFILSKDI